MKCRENGLAAILDVTDFLVGLIVGAAIAYALYRIAASISFRVVSLAERLFDSMN
ncbi:MAG TPA: hypothetical protein PLE18_14070 [Candidatus Sumerlaeota bacterium]|nr:hypothetical protein [Candidatus Sumerlaeota bacterium]